MDAEIVHPVYTPVELTPEQARMWNDTMALVSWTAPGFRHLFYKLLRYEGKHDQHTCLFTRDIPTAATNGRCIMANPDFLFGLSLQERAFVICHEIVHNVYDDISLLHRAATSGTMKMEDGTDIPFREQVLQHSMDYRINALLVDSHIGKLPAGGLYDTEIGTANDSVRDIYKKLYEDDDGEGGGSGKQGFDSVLAPGQGQQGSAQPRNQQQWMVEVAKAQTLEVMKAQGKMPGALMRMFQDILQPEIPWTDHIQTIINRRVGSGGYDWRRPDRRFIVRDIHMPSRSGHGAGWIVVWGDTSGSIGSDELHSYLGELSGIIEDVRPERLTICWCDAAIQRVDELEDASDLHRVRYDGAPGGGGTDVEPVLQWIDEQGRRPDMFIGFTDGYVDVPATEPVYPAIWACTTEKDFPWGEVVRIHPGRADA